MASVLDAHCPHLGAHLGRGGVVVGDCIRCPYHNWEFSGDGACSRIPFTDRIPIKARARAYETCEAFGLLFVRFQADEEPRGGPPPFPKVLAPGTWVGPRFYMRSVRVHAQEIKENIVDLAHFHAVHVGLLLGGFVGVPEIESIREDGPVWEVCLRVQATFLGVNTGLPIRITSYGPGVDVVQVSGVAPTISVFANTPINASETVVRCLVWTERLLGPLVSTAAHRLAAHRVWHGLNQDVPIWENKIYRPHPVLSPVDGPIIRFRRFMAQFYSKSAQLSPSVAI